MIIMFDFSLLFDAKFDDKDSILLLKNDKEIPLSINNEFIGTNKFRVKSSNKVIHLPNDITEDIAYLIGIILGDGYIKTPFKRERGGYFWEIIISGRYDFSKNLVPLIQGTFNYAPSFYKDKRKNDCWYVRIHSMIIHRFITKVIGLPSGFKAGITTWPNFVTENKNIFKHFVAGFVETDGYISNKYVAIIQKDKNFLNKMKFEIKNILGFEFNGPYINRKINNKICGWWLVSRNVKKFINLIPLRYKHAPITQLG